MKEKIKAFFLKYHPYIISLSLVLVCAVIPMLLQGVMCNDELISHLWANNRSFGEFFEQYFHEQVDLKGRPLSSLVYPLAMWVGFLGNDTVVFRIIQVLVILGCIVSFGVLIHSLFKSKAFSIFTCVFILAYIPITFEHTTPNAFNTIYNFAFMMLMISLLLYVHWLREKRALFLIVSMPLFFIACISYECFVAFVLVYLLLSFVESKEDKMWKRALTAVTPFSVAIIYLALYIVLGNIFQSQYQGNQVENFDLLKTLSIIGNLFLSALPGFFVFNRRYQYITNMYNDWSYLNIMRVAIITIAAVIVVTSLQKHAKGKFDWKKLIFVIVACSVISILPSIPVSVASGYQDAVGGNNNLALPVTFYSFFPSCLAVCYLLWEGWKSFSNKYLRALLVVLSVALIAPIQYMNGVLSDEQNRNYSRLRLIEDFVSSETMKKFDGKTFFAKDLFESRNALAINDGYWCDYAEFNGLNVVIANGDVDVPSYNYIFFVNDSYFVTWVDDQVVVSSKDEINQVISVKDKTTDDYYHADCTEPYKDKTGFYSYVFVHEDEKFIKSSFDADIGTDYASAAKKYGWYNDNWVEQESAFRIRTKESGTIYLTLFTPNELTGQEMGEIYLNNNLYTSFAFNQNEMQIYIQASPNSLATIKIKLNFLSVVSPGEYRPLSAVMSHFESL